MAKYFKPEEVIGLDPALIEMLDLAREKAGVPFVITSGFRTLGKNKGLSGAVGDSSHLTGHGVDLHVEDHHSFERLLYGLFVAGIHRYGLYFSVEGSTLVPRHIHVDNDQSKPPEVVWALLEQN